MCQWMISALDLVAFLHYFACGWIYIANRKKMIGYGHYHEFQDWESFFTRYIESLYFMTTTISTVGYGFGNDKGFKSNEGHWAVEMTYLYFVIIAGIILFSLVTEMIFSYKSMLTVYDIMNGKSKEMEIFMYEISLRRKDKMLDMGMINYAIEGMKHQVRDNTNVYFAENKFFKELPQNLQYRLVKSVLHRQYKIFKFFFEDFSGKTKATEAFMFRVLTRLKSQMFHTGEIVLSQNSRVRDLLVIGKGHLELFGFFTDK